MTDETRKTLIKIGKEKQVKIYDIMLDRYLLLKESKSPTRNSNEHNENVTFKKSKEVQ